MGNPELMSAEGIIIYVSSWNFTFIEASLMVSQGFFLDLEFGKLGSLSFSRM